MLAGFLLDQIQSKTLSLVLKEPMADGTYYNVSYYLIDWDNPQLNTSTPVNGYYAVINGESAETNGLDVEFSGTLGAIDWSVGYAYNNARLSSDLYTPADVPVLSAKSGAKLPGSPQNTFNLNLAHTTYFGKTDDFLSGMGMVNRLDLYAQSSSRKLYWR
jgi:outer membrane receptor for ferric coprogen and ferric-rhodotorulic acid